MKDINAMTGPELVEEFNLLADLKGYQRVKRFADLEVGRRRLGQIMKAPSALPAAAAEVVTPSPKEPRAAWRSRRIIVKVEGNPRRAGTAAFDFYAAMVAYLNSHSSATAGDVIDNTTYRPQDLHWDLARGSIELK